MADQSTPEHGARGRHRDFLTLWAAQSITMVGGQIAFLALPLVAILTLGATPLQMGLLTAFGALPALLGLVAGGWIDRLPRRLLLAGSNVSRALVVLAVPAAALGGVLRFELLAAVVLVSGVLALLFEAGSQALLPALVGRERLVAANSRLELSRATSELVGPALAGGLLQIFAAPLVLVLYAASYLASALLLRHLQEAEVAVPPVEARCCWDEMLVGLRAIGGSGELRAVIGCAATVSLFNAALEPAVFLYVPRELGVSPGLFGLIFAVGSAGALVGAAVATRFGPVVGPYPLLGGGLLIAALGDLLTPLAVGSPLVVGLTLGFGAVLFGVGVSVYRVLMASLRQQLAPDALQGRVALSAMAAIQLGVLLGALLGGALGELTSPRVTLFVGGFGELLAVLWLLPLLRR